MVIPPNTGRLFIAENDIYEVPLEKDCPGRRNHSHKESYLFTERNENYAHEEKYNAVSYADGKWHPEPMASFEQLRTYAHTNNYKA